jgi:hypothetical protein
MNHAIEILMLKWNEYYKQYSEIPEKNKPLYGYETDDEKLSRLLRDKMESCINAIVELRKLDYPKCNINVNNNTYTV